MTTAYVLTLYNEGHFFNANPLKRYSLGTKNKNLKLNPDGSLTLYAGAKSPGKDKETNWLPATPNGAFSLYIRAYWPDKAIVDRSWKPAGYRDHEVIRFHSVNHNQTQQMKTKQRNGSSRISQPGL